MGMQDISDERKLTSPQLFIGPIQSDIILAGIYLFKVINRNRTMCEIC